MSNNENSPGKAMHATDMQTRYAVVTGASGGIGRCITEGLAQMGYRVVMACRDTAKGEQIRRQIEAGTHTGNHLVLPLDLASFASIRKFAASLDGLHIRPEILVNNAGTMSARFCLTEDGLERTLAVNYAGAFLLTRLLVPRMPQDRDCTVTLTVSCTYRLGKTGPDFFRTEEKLYKRFGTYGSSKLALLHFTASLAERLHTTRIRVRAVDPGVVDTGMITMQRWFDPLADLLFRPFIKRPRAGAVPTLCAVADPSPRSGVLYRGRRCMPLPRQATDPQRCEALWRETCLVTGISPT